MPTYNLDQIKSVPITSYLACRNIQPVSYQGGEYLYLSPQRNEKTPSFCVNPSKNVFKDFGGSGEDKGDVIRLVQLVENCGFQAACQILLDLSNLLPSAPTLSPCGNNLEKPEKEIEILAVKPLTDKRLFQYAANRGISEKLAQKYLKQIHRLAKAKNYVNVGFENDLDGYEIKFLMNGKSKTLSSGRKAITTISIEGSKNVNVFEGCFDFLSALEFFGKDAPTNTTIILNSTSMLKSTIPYLRNFQKVYCYLDNDESGRAALETMKKENISIVDCSGIYSKYKDFNEFLTKK